GAPAVLVIADQVARLVGREGGLAGAGQAEEQRHVAFFADVGGAVHRQHVGFGQQVVLYREHGLLHFTGVAHAGDQDLLLSEVDDHAAVGVGAVTFRGALEVGDVEHLPLVPAGRVVLLGIDEQLTAEEVLPGRGGGHLHRQVVGFGGAYMNVGNEVILGLVEGFDAVPEGIELVGGERTVDRTPGDGIPGARFFDDIAIGWRTTGPVSGFDNERAIGGQFTFPTLDGFFDQSSGADINGHGVNSLRHEF